MDRNIRIAIIGAGLCGLSTALALARLGFRQIQIFERSPSLGEVGAGLTLGPNATRALIALGLGDALQQSCDEPHAGITRHWKTGAVLMRSARGSVIREHYGAPYYQIHRADMLDILVQAIAKNSAINIKMGMGLLATEENAQGAVLIFSDRQKFSADIVIGCDGLKSSVSESLFGATAANFSGYVAWRALVPAAAFSARLEPPAQLFIGIERLFMRYLVRHGELINIVAIARAQGWDEEGWMLPSTVEELRAQYFGWHEDILHTINLVPVEQCFKWAIHVREAIPTWYSNAIVLAGDAAHPMVPFMGMGASTAIEDAVVLARALALHEDRATAFLAYQTARHTRASFIQAQSAQRGLRLMSADPDSYGAEREVSEDSLGLFAYDAFSA